MSTSQELEQQLKQKQDALSRLVQGGGQLSKQITDAWNQAGGAEQAALRQQEGKMLTDYVAAAPTARETYKDIWDPFVRDRLAAQQVQQQYAPISQIRQELAARADALNAAQQSAYSMYNSDVQRGQQDIGYTQDAYNRAWQKEQAAAAQAEAERNRQFQAQQNALSRAASRARSSEPSAAEIKSAKQLSAISTINNYVKSGDWVGNQDFEKKFLPELRQAYGDVFSSDELNKIAYEARKPFEQPASPSSGKKWYQFWK